MRLIGFKLGLSEQLLFLSGVIASYLIFGQATGTVTFIMLIFILTANHFAYKKRLEKEGEKK